MTHFVVPDSVHTTSEDDGGLVLLNVATGQWHKLNRTGNELCSEICAGGLDVAVEVFTSRYPRESPEGIRVHAEELLSALVERGLLEPGGLARGSGGVPIALAPRTPVALRPLLVAAVALPLALVLLRLPFRVTVKGFKLVKRGRARRTATRTEALQALAAAKRVSRFHLGRVACLELSLTAALTAALRGGSVQWCLGVASDPQSFHAWIEADGEPVTDPYDDPIPLTYQRVLAV
ncbi:Transglutaminase-like superfamily protein [Lentzea waywayandensis]|uniref:Transglutaminase-like superfamily protein n=1 Tax=Lentzea waywayandensis TaxID=84724 RepID=A0A1I6ESS5_9PSEU|nr:lasso peptide biosynthesis B2 protein [Lentzea waywayandensis]SFR20538.1 Transglutaminase-like superfamily protein [Lentzea waywayandensis]